MLRRAQLQCFGIFSVCGFVGCVDDLLAWLSVWALSLTRVELHVDAATNLPSTLAPDLYGFGWVEASRGGPCSAS